MTSEITWAELAIRLGAAKRTADRLADAEQHTDRREDAEDIAIDLDDNIRTAARNREQENR